MKRYIYLSIFASIIYCNQFTPINNSELKHNQLYLEIDKEDMVFPTTSGFSGDKKHEERAWGSFDILLD